MGKITILETVELPITRMGERAGICYCSDITNQNKNYQRGLDCIESGHGRILEFVTIDMAIEDYSARVIREWYTHIGGSPTRLQASTRYIDPSEFGYVIPPSIENNENAKVEYIVEMESLLNGVVKLEKEYGIPREDAAMMLPLGMKTKIVDKRNLRNLIDMSHQRMCARAYWEYRLLFNDISNALRDISGEWAYIVDHYFVPKCEVIGSCPEKNGCGRMKTLEEKLNEYEKRRYFLNTQAMTCDAIEIGLVEGDDL